MDAERLGRAVHGGDHYENFPVASWLLPQALRPDVLALYRFARAGDDLADEPSSGPISERLKGLSELAAGLDGDPRSDHFTSLGFDLRQRLDAKGLSPEPAHNLLSAFEQDTCFAPFREWDAVADYCSRSANPVGQMLLGFAGIHEASAHAASNNICSGLQLVNFAQDLHEDLSRGRPYLPKTAWPDAWDWTDPTTFSSQLPPAEQSRLTHLLVDRGIHHLELGRDLPASLRRLGPSPSLRLAIEIALTRRGGLWVAHQLRAAPLVPWTRSIRIRWHNMMGLLLRAILDMRMGT
ncbi:MAG: squalene/phytoene synthase family protein [Burkholderiaceae bacterium]|jgi:phytoene/squalene synthetase|nr:squalene/phytoene synthase family protein [Burkholderiaceae bacterium]